MRHCPNETCPHRRRFGAPCEYRDGFNFCAECGGALVDGAAPASSAAAPRRVRTDPGPRHPLPWSRLLVTALAPAVVLAVSFIPLPGVDPDFLRSFTSGATAFRARQLLMIGSLGLMPFIWAFVVVELAVALVPGWRPLRTRGVRGRARLGFPIALFGTLFAVVQAFGIVRWMDDLGRRSSVYGFGADPLSDHGMATLVMVAASLVAATLVLVFLSGFISRRGIGNGYSVVILCSGLLAALPRLGSLERVLTQEVITPVGVFLSLAAIAGLAALTVFAVGESGRQRLRTGPLRLPLSGIDPALAAATIAGYLWRPLDLHRTGMVTVTAILVVVAAVADSLLFNQPSRVSDALTRIGGPSARRAEAMTRVREAFPRAVLLTIAFCAVVALAGSIVELVGGMLVIAGSTVVLLTACVYDLVSEIGAWRRMGALVSVWPLHQVYAADAVVEALEAETVPFFLRGAAFRSMSPFFSSFVPIEVLVPQADAQRAFELLDGRLDERKPAAPPAIDASGTQAA